MAFSSSLAQPPWNIREGSGYVTRKYTFTNGAGDTGGTIDTGFGEIQDVTVNVTSHSGGSEPQLTISAPNVTIAVDAGVDGDVYVKGRSVA